jgi:hypothetical protein
MLTHAMPRPVVAESIVLADGRHVAVRPVTPASKPLIAAAMTRLSPQSIRRRFFAPRRELSELELHRLTAMDGWNQFALGACTRAIDGTLQGIGKGLVAQLAATAAVRGIRTLQAIVLPDNAAIIGLLQRYAPWARWRRDGDDLIAVIPLPAEPIVVAAYR